MAGLFPIAPGLSAGTAYGIVLAGGGVSGTVITASGSTNTKGSYTALTSSTTYDSAFAVVTVAADPGTGNNTLTDIAIGGAGNEQVIINNIGLVANAFVCSAAVLCLPISIPASTRIAARCQSSVASSTVYATVTLFSSDYFGLDGYAGVDALGVTTASTSLTSITAGNAAYSAYTAISSSTSRDYCGLFALFTMGSGGGYVAEIAVGGAGSEKVIINVPYFEVGNNTYFHPCFFQTPIASGSRVAMALASNTGGTVASTVALYGVYQ